MGTDKTQFYETRNLKIHLLSVLVVKFVVKILFPSGRGRNGTANHAKGRERKMKIFNGGREESEVGVGGPPRRLVATGVRKKLNRESRETTRKEFIEVSSVFLIRAGREIRGQNSFSNGMRKKWNRESRERTRKED